MASTVAVSSSAPSPGRTVWHRSCIRNTGVGAAAGAAARLPRFQGGGPHHRRAAGHADSGPGSRLSARDLVAAGDQVIVAQGGRGGRGNRSRSPPPPTGRRARSSRALRVRKTLDHPGNEGHRRCRADWFAQRRQIDAAQPTVAGQPEISDYPFTTKHPNLGQVQLGEERTLVLADLPGLIEGPIVVSGSATNFYGTSNGPACWCIWLSRFRRTKAIR